MKNRTTKYLLIASMVMSFFFILYDGSVLAQGGISDIFMAKPEEVERFLQESKRVDNKENIDNRLAVFNANFSKEVSIEKPEKAIKRKVVVKKAPSTEIKLTGNQVKVCNPAANFYSWESQLYNNETGQNKWAKGTLQHYYNSKSYTDENGFSRYDGYYLVAMGNMYGPVGKKYQIEFTSGQKINVMLGDTKGDRCAHSGGSNGSMLEFIVDTQTSKAMSISDRSRGTLSNYFKGNISKITIIE